MVWSDFTRQEYTDHDFLRLIEHRMRKDLRQGEFIDVKAPYQIEGEETVPGQLLKHFLSNIFQDRLELGGGSPLHTKYLESYLSVRLASFLDGKDKDIFAKREINPLRSVTFHEIKEAANILDIKGKLDKHTNPLVESLHEKYPQTKQSFLKSFENIEQLSSETFPEKTPEE